MGGSRRIEVEGDQDKHVLFHLLNLYGVPRDGIYEVHVCGSIEILLKELPVVLKASDISSVAVVADANSNPTGRWFSIKAVLAECGYHVERETGLDTGLICRGEADVRPDVGAWLMPDNESPGALEAFMKSIKPHDSELWEYAETVINNIPREKRRFCAQCSQVEADVCALCSNRMKAVIHTWLAWQESPGTPLGQAITKNYFDAQAALAIKFMRWLFDLWRESYGTLVQDPGS
jgi:hypothetical protein